MFHVPPDRDRGDSIGLYLNRSNHDPEDLYYIQRNQPQDQRHGFREQNGNDQRARMPLRDHITNDGHSGRSGGGFGMPNCLVGIEAVVPEDRRFGRPPVDYRENGFHSNSIALERNYEEQRFPVRQKSHFDDLHGRNQPEEFNADVGLRQSSHNYDGTASSRNDAGRTSNLADGPAREFSALCRDQGHSFGTNTVVHKPRSFDASLLGFSTPPPMKGRRSGMGRHSNSNDSIGSLDQEVIKSSQDSFLPYLNSSGSQDHGFFPAAKTKSRGRTATASSDTDKFSFGCSDGDVEDDNPPAYEDHADHSLLEAAPAFSEANGASNFPLLTSEKEEGYVTDSSSEHGGGFGPSNFVSAFMESGEESNVKERKFYSSPKVSYRPQYTAAEDLYANRLEAGTLFTTMLDMNIRVFVNGSAYPQRQLKCYSSFYDMPIPPQVLQNLGRCKYRSPTPIQAYVMSILEDQKSDLFGVATTGSGKTAAFLLPIVSELITRPPVVCSGSSHTPSCVILTPTRELARQVYDDARRFCLDTALQDKICVVYGGAGYGASLEHLGHARGRPGNWGVQILVATMGRLKHLVDNSAISFKNVRYLVLDEADRMLEQGFRKDLEDLGSKYDLPAANDRQTVMFSATCSAVVLDIASKFLRENFVHLVMGEKEHGEVNFAIEAEFLEIPKAEKKDKLLSMLNVNLQNMVVIRESGVFMKKTLVFVQRKVQAEMLAGMLCEAGVMAISMSGELNQAGREEALHMFITGQKEVMVASGLAERGLDIKGVEHVILFDLPRDIDTVIHRVGRTGRIGNPGRATIFFDPEFDCRLAPDLVSHFKGMRVGVPAWLEGYGNAYGIGVTAARSSLHAIQEEDPWA